MRTGMTDLAAYLLSSQIWTKEQEVDLTRIYNELLSQNSKGSD